MTGAFNVVLGFDDWISIFFLFSSEVKQIHVTITLQGIETTMFIREYRSRKMRPIYCIPDYGDYSPAKIGSLRINKQLPNFLFLSAENRKAWAHIMPCDAY